MVALRDSAFAGVTVPDPTEEIKTSGKKSKLCRQCQSNSAERMFTVEEVKAICAKAVRKTEEELRFEYDRILQDRLAEQFHNFSKSYEDSVSRMSKQGDRSYVS